MPIYDYTCGRCGHLAEVIHGIHEDGPRFCPSCGAEGTMRKGFAAPAVHFKGSGWAKKDRSASSAPSKAKPSKATDDSGSGAGDTGSSEPSKPATATTSTAASEGE